MTSPSSAPATPSTTTGTTTHAHRCMRCHEEFTCQTPGECVANYDVLPTIVTRGADGRPVLTEHCPHLAAKAAQPTACAHCWHVPPISTSLACWPPRHEQVCCHCGIRQYRAVEPPPIPAGHGPHYPRGIATTISIIPAAGAGL